LDMDDQCRTNSITETFISCAVNRDESNQWTE
jgi:hypothetical protein